MKGQRKSWVCIVFAIMLCTLLTGCVQIENPAKVPFSNSEYQGRYYQDVITDLQDAGFSNIETDTMLTYSESKAGTVGTITIDGDNLFRKDDIYEYDVTVVVSYYEMSENKPQETSAPQTTTTSEAVTIDPKEYTADAGSIEQLAKDVFGFNYDELTVEYDDFDEAFVVSFHPTDMYTDSTSWVWKNINRYINFCRIAYQIDGLDRVRFDIYANGIDQYGNEGDFLGLSEIMTRETFENFNWDGLYLLGIWDAFVDNCFAFSLHPLFSEDLDTDRIFYDSFMRDGMLN